MTQASPPAPHCWQSFELKQCAAHRALTHSRPVPQSAFVLHCGVRPVLATQVPATQTSCELQLSFVEQAPWQVPLMQVWPLAQSVLSVQLAPPVGLSTQWPPASQT